MSTEKNGQEWGVGRAERIFITKPIVTGQDGYARLEVAGGTSFEVFANSLLTFRRNVGNPQDLLDISTGRVRLQLQMSADQPTQYHVRTPVAIITAHGNATFTLAVDDEDNSTRIDVERGEILVQHALLPRGDPLVIQEGDAIAVEEDEPLISRRLDRGSLYRYAFHTIIRTLSSAVPGLSGRNVVDDATEDVMAGNTPLERPEGFRSLQ